MPMNLKKYSADKIALLGLLLLGFLIAQIIISTGRGIKLSGPVSLAKSGLSVQIPKGDSWKNTDWLYNENRFHLFSILSLNSQQVVWVQWQYLLTPAEADPAEQIKQRKLHYKGQLANTSQKNIGSLVMDWGHITAKGKIETVFFGVVKLNQHRTVTLEVVQKAGLGDLAKEVFDAIAESISFQDNKLLADGAEFAGNFKDGRIADILYGKDTHKYFLIDSETGQTSGFIAEAMAQTEDDDGQAAVGVVSLYNINEPTGGSEQSVFSSGMFLDTFHWVNKSTNTQGRTKAATDITLNQQGIVTIQNPISRQAGQFAFGATAIPEALLELVLIDFIDSDYERIILDLIHSSGLVVSAVISKVDYQNNNAPLEDAAYVVKVNFLDAEQNHYLMYFDSSKNIVRIDVKGDSNYRIERTSKETVLEKFTEWQQQISQIDTSFR